MQLAINVNDAVADKLLWFLDHFKEDGVEVSSMDDYLKNKRYLEEELARIDSGEGKMLTEEEFWAGIDATLAKNG